MKRAADANTVGLAEKEMTVVVENMEARGMTNGYTSVLYKTPDEDVKFWYDNMNSSLTELKAVKPDAGQTETSNVLMKLKETLLDDTETGTTITVPDGISRFPNNKAYALASVITIILLIIGVVLIFI